MNRLLVLASTLAAIALPAAAQTPLEAVLSAEPTGPLYSFDMTFEGKNIQASGRVDPSQPEGERITVYTPAEDEWDEAFRTAIDEMEADAKGEIWCADLAEHIPADAVLLEETDKTSTYTFTPRAGADAPEEEKLFKNLKGRVTIANENPAILALHMMAEKAFKPAPIARIKTFNMQIDCARSPDGRTYVAQFDMSVSGSALMQKFDEREIRTISNLQQVAENAPALTD